MTRYSIRTARVDDASALLSIYAPLVETTAISLEQHPPSPDEFAGRIETALASHTWLVAEDDTGPAGFAYGSSMHRRWGYRLSTETSVYVAERSRGTGVGSRLYAKLLPDLAERGFRQAFAVMTVPNAASETLHRRAGFVPVGLLPKAGHKFGTWHDVAWWHREL